MHVQNLVNTVWDIRIFLGLVPKESPCIWQCKLTCDYFEVVGCWDLVHCVFQLLTQACLTKTQAPFRCLTVTVETFVDYSIRILIWTQKGMFRRHQLQTPTTNYAETRHNVAESRITFVQHKSRLLKKSQLDLLPGVLFLRLDFRVFCQTNSMKSAASLNFHTSQCIQVLTLWRRNFL